MVLTRNAFRALGVVAVLVLALPTSGQIPKETPKESPKEPPKLSAEQEKAREAFLAGKLDDAIKALQAAAKNDPTIAPPRVILAQWSVQVQQGQQARILIEEAAAEDPTHPQVFLANAGFALNEGRITDAILGCTEALRLADSPRWDAERRKLFQRDARMGLVAAYERRGDVASARSILVALLEADPRNAKMRYQLARANFLSMRQDDAFEELKRAFKDDPTEIDPPEMAMAQFWSGKGDNAKAEEWWLKAVTTHAGSAKVQRGFAGHLLNVGRLDAAKTHLAAAQKIEPNSRDTKLLAGMYARYTKDYTTATQVFEELAREHPSFGPATFNLALVLAEAGDANAKRRASELAEGYVKQNQRSADAWSLYAHCLSKAGRMADAERAAQNVFSLGQAQLGLDGAYFVARVLADRGSNEAAHKLIKAIVEKKDWFLHRKESEALLAELDKKVGPPKK
jgi:tetratricopeptide (TPR) repeat protein